MNYIKFTQLKIILFFLIFLFSFANDSLINSPEFVKDGEYPLVYTSNDKINIITSGKKYSQNLETREISGAQDFCEYSYPYMLISSENPLYIYDSNTKYLQSLINSDCYFKNLSSLELPTSNEFIGYIQETSFLPFEHYIIPSNVEITGLRCKTLDNEIIIYGIKTEEKKIYFSFVEKNYTKKIDIICPDIEEIMSCKKIINSLYICTIICSGKAYISIYALKTKIHRNDDNCELEQVLNEEINSMGRHKEIRMFDTTKEDEKLICSKNTNNNKMECLLIHLEYNEYEVTIEEPIETDGSGTYNKSNNYNITILSENDIDFSFPLTDNNEYCVFKESITNEYLFCCGGTAIIYCVRINGDYKFIDSFTLTIDGVSTHLDFVSSSNFIILYYMNNMNNINSNKIYRYSIYLPECVDKTYTITTFHSFSDDINNLFKKIINSKYYIEFANIPSEYGNLTVDDELIDINFTDKIYIENSKILNFTSLNDQTVENFKFTFLISMTETFSKECSINLNIIPCYRSCYECTKSELESNNENHNCLPNSCKEDYYVDPEVNTNCFRPTEGKSNWYFDYEESKFSLCHDSCASCLGPSETDCLSCKQNTELKFLANNKCYTKCPDGFYTSSNNNKCEQCYETCSTCTGYGDNEFSMKCSSCKENSISRGNCCFKIYNLKEKTFYAPKTNQITSCFELYEYYINEDSFECVEKIPEEGYYLSNERTGVYSPCHHDCKTCYGNYSESNTNCILCSDENLYFLNKNCISNCPEGYYPKEKTETEQKQCVECFQRCKSCEKGQEYQSAFKLSKMNCLTCKKELNSNDPNNLIDKYIFVDYNCFSFITYTEEKITFDISIISSNPTNNIGTCLDYNLSIFYGEYSCVEKPDNSYYVLNNEENTGVIKYCNQACSSCKGEPTTQDTNCISCSNGYFKTEDSETNCILETLIPDNYYKNTNNNIYYKCYPNCKTCKRSLDIEANINEMGCEICKENYYLVYQTTNCHNMSFLDNNIEYFFDSNDHQFHKCYDNCKKCISAGIDENNQNCEECLDNYYFEENTKNCLNFSYLEKGYYFDNFTINLESESPKFKKCHSNCKTCSNQLIGEDMNCNLCKSGYYKIINTSNCIDDITNKGYYLNDNIAFPCEENCLTCSNGKADINENNVDNNGEIITNITNNCLSCDQSKNLFLVEDIKICESLDFKNKGYYLEENQSGIKIFHRCYKSCSLCEKGKEIDSSTHNEIYNCDGCANNYYKLLGDTIEKNCYGDEMLEQGYRLARNFWQFCHENCGNCINRPVYDVTNTYIINQNCKTCYEGFKFIHGTKNCANESYLEKGYYYDDITQEYFECDISCISCQKYSTQDDPKCIKCNNEKGYFNADNKPNDKCYNRDNIEQIYVLSVRYDEDGNLYRKWVLCYMTCLNCFKYGNEEEHGCTTCIAKHYLIYNSSNCVTDNYALNNGYYFNKTYGQFVKCDDSCVNCYGGPIDDNTNCKKCNNENEYYSIEGKSTMYCYNSETIEEGYYLNKIDEPFIWSTCYENCATCEFKGNENKMHCLSCKTNLKNKFDKIIYFLFINGNCIESCPDNLFLTKEGDCVENCPSGTYKFQLNYNYSCVDFCPDDYLISSDGKRCELPEFQNYITLSEFKSIISNEIITHVNSSKIIELDNLKSQIFYSKDLDTNAQINNKMTGINNIENFIQKLKIKNNININEDVIVVLIESKENKIKNENLNKDKDIINLGKGIEILLYDKSGNKLDTSNLKNENITIMKYVGDIPYVDFNEGKNLYQNGIDVFNESDPFFNDLCYPYKSKYDSDIILSDRRADLFQNITFCEEGCTYSGVDYELMIVNCICDINSLNNNNEDNSGIILNNNKKDFTNKLYKSNIVLAKCSNLVFNSEILKNNVGFIAMTCLSSIEVIFIGIFLKNGLKPIKNFMLIFAAPPKLKRLMSITEKRNENNKEEEIKKTILINRLLTRSNTKRINKKIKNDINEGNDALYVDYSISDEDDYESKRKSISQIDENEKYDNNSNIEDQKNIKSEFNSESDSEKEKRTRFSRKSHLKKRRKSKNNLVFPKKDIYNEKPKHLKDLKNKQIHPIDTIDFDAIEIHKNNDKKKYISSNFKKRNNIYETEKQQLETNKNTDEDIYNQKKKKNNLSEDEEGSEKKLRKKKIKNQEKDKNKGSQNNIQRYNKRSKTFNHKEKSNINLKNNDKKNNYVYTSDEFSIMDYKEAVKNDKRSWCKIYIGYLFEKNSYLNAFVSDSFIDLRTIKINFLCFRLEIIFVLNALFYTDSYISSAYHNNGKLGFFTSLPKSLYSILVSIIATLFFKLLTSNKKEIVEIIKNKKDNDEYTDSINTILNKFKIKLIVFFILQILFSLVFLYYISAFCAVYQNSKFYWLYGCLESILFDIIISFIYCIFLATFRYYGLVKRTKCLFDFTNILDILL